MEEDILPSYVCTVFKEGYVKIKREIVEGRRETARRWKKVYFKLTGTKLDIYQRKGDELPVFTVSMYKVLCGFPVDYLKSDTVLRITLVPIVDQYLIKPIGGPVQFMSWFEHLQSATNISADIDVRKMPDSRGFTIHRLLQHSHIKTVTIDLGYLRACIPVLPCLSTVLKYLK